VVRTLNNENVSLGAGEAIYDNISYI